MTEAEASHRVGPVSARDVVFLLGLALALHLLLPQLGGIRRSADAAAGASVPWLVAAALAFLVSIVAGGAALLGATTLALPLRRSATVAFTATALGHLSPGGVAGLRLLQRALEHAGADRDVALGAVGLLQAADVVVTVVLLAGAAVAVGTGDLDPVSLPSGWVVVAAVAGALLLSGVLLRSRLGTSGWSSPLARRPAAPCLFCATRAGPPSWLVAPLGRPSPSGWGWPPASRPSTPDHPWPTC